MPGEIVYFVIPVPDGGRAQAFYGGLFGWDFTPGNLPEGFNIQGSRPAGGLFGGADEASGIDVYFTVDDIAAAGARVRELGGEAGEVQETDAGLYASCRDDQGTGFSLFKARDR
jgi:predicted enzyme related to lactoylglutathione lyase